jgi:uncharacterized cupin superfamily protein
VDDLRVNAQIALFIRGCAEFRLLVDRPDGGSYMKSKLIGCTTIDPAGENGNGLEDIPHEPSDTAVEGAKHPQGYIAFTEATEQFTGGVWACDAGLMEIRDNPIDEFCVVIDGEVEVGDDRGNRQTFNEGDAFILHKGFTGTWRMPRAFRKFSCAYSEKSD